MSSTALAPFEPPNHVYSAFAFISFVMCVVPVYWHLEAWNMGTLLYMFWTGLAVFNMFINSIIWDGNAINSAPVWCDISSRIIIASNVGTVLASLCIERRLYKIVSAKSVMITSQDKRKAIFIDLAIGFGVPLIQQLMYAVVQGHRFDIVEDVGCWPTTYVTPVSIALIFTWPIVIGVISTAYAFTTIWLVYKHRRNFNSLIKDSHNLNSSRYIRLMCLGGTEILTVPLASWALAVTIQGGVSPWISWADTHSDFGRVDLVPAVLWRSSSLGVMNYEMYRWFLVLCAFVFFGFFGFADEAIKNYRLVYTSVASRLGYSTMSFTWSSSGNLTSSKSRDDHLFDGKKSVLPAFLKSDYSHTTKSAQHKEDPLGETLDSSFDLGGDLNIDTSGSSSNFGMAVMGRRVDIDLEKGNHDQNPWSPIETMASSSMHHLDRKVQDDDDLPRRPEVSLDLGTALPARSTRESRPLSMQTI